MWVRGLISPGGMVLLAHVCVPESRNWWARQLYGTITREQLWDLWCTELSSCWGQGHFPCTSAQCQLCWIWLWVMQHLLCETQICGHWKSWSSWRCFCSLQEGWTRRALKVPSNPIDSVALWLYFLFITMLIKRLFWKFEGLCVELVRNLWVCAALFLIPVTFWHRADGFSSPVSHLCLAATGHFVPWQGKCESPWRVFLLSPRYQNLNQIFSPCISLRLHQNCFFSTSL